MRDLKSLAGGGGVQPKEAEEECLEHVSSAPVNFYFSGDKAKL